jgi:hypothetical protein
MDPKSELVNQLNAIARGEKIPFEVYTLQSGPKTVYNTPTNIETIIARGVLEAIRK